MSFSKTIETLEKCDQKSQIYLEDILGVITKDLYDDIKNSSSATMDKLPVNNEDEYILYLNSLIGFARRSYDNNKELITEDKRAARWEKENKKLNEFTDRIDGLNEDIEKFKKKLSEVETKENEYNSILAEKKDLNDQIREKNELLAELDSKVKEADQIKLIITELADVKIPNCDADIYKLKENEKDLLEKYERFSKEIGEVLIGKRDDALKKLESKQKLNDRVYEEWSEALDKQKTLEEETRQYKSSIEESNIKAEEAAKEIDCLKNEEQRIADNIEELEKNRIAEEEKKKAMDSEFIQISEKLEMAATERNERSKTLEELEVQLNDALSTVDAQKLELDELVSRITSSNNKATELREEIKRKNDENVQIQSDIDVLVKDLEKQMKEYRDLCLDYSINKSKRSNATINHIIQVKQYNIIHENYKKFIAALLEDDDLKESLSQVNDEDLRKALEEKEYELDKLLREELNAFSKLLKKYDIELE